MFRLQIVLEISSVEKLHLAHTKFTSSSFTITGVVVAQICLGLKKFRPKRFCIDFLADLEHYKKKQICDHIICCVFVNHTECMWRVLIYNRSVENWIEQFALKCRRERDNPSVSCARNTPPINEKPHNNSCNERLNARIYLPVKCNNRYTESTSA